MTAADGSGVTTVLLRTAGDERALDAVQAELVALGPRAQELLFELAAGGPALEELFESGRELVVPPDRLVRFAVGTLERFPSREARSLLRRVAQEEFDADRWSVALELSGGSGGDVALWWELSQGFERLAWRSRLVHQRMTEALVRLLRADPAEFVALEHLAEELDEESLALCVGAVLEADQPRGVSFLLSPRLEPLGAATRLDALGRLAERFPWHQPQAVEAFVLRHVRAKEHSVRRSAVRWSGRLHLVGAIDALVALAEDDAARARGVAAEALRTILGPRGVRPWSEHAERELAFREGPAVVLAAELVGENPAVCVQHMRELAAHPIVRHQMARQLADEFELVPAAALPVVVHTLVSVESRHAVPGLVAALFGPDATRARHAWRALTALTELDLPCEAPAWVRAFDL